MIRHSVHTLKEGTIERYTAVARLRLVHRDETHFAVLSAGDEVLAELGLATQRLRKCCEKGDELLSLSVQGREDVDKYHV
jgi:succinylarginine dihydrolase